MAEQQASGSCELSAQGIDTENAVSVSQTTKEKSEDNGDWMRVDEIGLDLESVFNSADNFFTDFEMKNLMYLLQPKGGKISPPFGFDERAVFEKILKIGKDSAEKDVQRMVAFAVERGNNLEKIVSHSSAAVKSEIKRLISKYGLVPKATSPESITLDRVCLAFPPLTCKYMQTARNTVVDRKALLSACSDYPLFMMHKAFATLIPNSLSEECKKIIIDAHCLHQAHFCAIIGRSRDGSNKKPRDYIESCGMIINKYIANTHITMERKLRFMKDWNIIDENGNPTPPVVNAASKLHSLTADFLPTV